MAEQEPHQFDYMTEPELTAMFNALADKIMATLPKETGFILLAAPFGSHGIVQYVSNVERDDAAKWMAETIECWKTGDYVPRVGA